MIRNGIDLIEISRIEKSLKINGFSEKVYGKDELSQQNSLQSLAGAFAAKEAFSKAIGTGIRNFTLDEVQVLHDALGAPYFSLSGKAKEIADRQGLKFSVSITHTENYAAAMVTAYTEE